MKKKNYIGLGLALILAVGLTACGKKTEVEQPVTSESEPAAEATENEAGAADQAEENTEEQGEEETATTGEFSLSFKTKEVSHEEGEDGFLNFATLNYEMPETINLPGCETCVESIKAYFSDREKELLAADSDYAADAKSKFEAQTESDSWYGPSQNSVIKVQRADAQVVSLKEEYRLYGGNEDYSDPTGYTKAVNFDAQTGKILTLADIASDEEALKMIVEEVSGMSLSEDCWALTSGGFLVMEPEMEWGNYGAEFSDYLINYDELAQVLKAEYVPTAEDYTAYFKDGQEVMFDLDDDGTKERISLYMNVTVDDEYGTYGDYYLKVDDQEIMIADYAYDADAYLIKRQDHTAGFMVNAYFESEYSVVFPVMYQNGELTMQDRVTGSVECNTVKPDSFAMETSVDVLGTWGCDIVYNISEDYQLTPATGEYLLHNDKDLTWRRNIVVAKDLTVYGEDGSDTGEVLFAGTALYPSRTDFKTYMIAEKEDGTKVMIKLERITETETYEGGVIEYHQFQIDGESADDYFEPLPYAG